MVLFPPPARWIYVNGVPAVPAEGVVRDGAGLRVPERLAGEIRARLRRAPPPAPPPSRPPPPPVAAPAPPKPAPEAVRDLAGYRVVIDPGHGGKDPGAAAVSGLREKAVTLDVGLRTAALLRARGAEVRLTRGGDRFLPLEERAAIANRLRAHLFVSIHADSASRSSARGYSVYVARRASPRSLAAARAILAALAGNGFPNRGLRRADFRVLVRTTGPAVLVELGFLSNAAEAARLAAPTVRKSLAESLARGIARALRGSPGR